MEKRGDHKEKKKKTKNKTDRYNCTECTLKLMNGRIQIVLEVRVQENSVQFVNEKLAALMRTVKEPKKTEIEGRRPEFPENRTLRGSNLIDGKEETIMACCQGNCFIFVLLCFLLYFVLSCQGQKMRGKIN